jgi:hypothetical protein
MGRTYSTYVDYNKCIKKYWLSNGKERIHLEKLDKEERIITNLILKKQSVRMCIRFKSLRIGSSFFEHGNK